MTARKAPKEPDAIALLTEDHRMVEKLFDLYKKTEDDADKSAICEQVCGMLTVHCAIEEEIFYPAAREALPEEDLIDEAEVEHDVAKGLIAQLEDDGLEDEKRDATFEVLTEYVGHHVEEEESQMFKQVRKTDLDLVALGAEMRARKAELEAELGIGEDEEDSAETDDEATGADSGTATTARKR